MTDPKDMATKIADVLAAIPPSHPYALRYNSGKIDYTLVPVDALSEEAAVWDHGQAKYGRGNWEKLWGENTVQVVVASMLRHINAIQMGEVRDPESGHQHAAHIRCNAAMLIRYFNI